MSSDNIDGNLLTEMILDRYEAAIQGKCRAEADANEHRGKAWSLEQDIKRKDERITNLIADNARLEQERDALKAQLAGSAGDDGNPF
jgi:hypothetical protein